MHRAQAVVACSIALVPALEAGTLRVGTSPQAGFATIQPALDQAEDGDTVVVEPGEYVLLFPLQFHRMDATSDPAGPPLKELVLISLEGAERTTIRVSEPPSRRSLSVAFLFDKGEGSRSVVEGFTIQSGSGYSLFEENQWRNLGTAVTCIGSSPTFRSCRFLQQEGVSALGALIHLERSSPRLIDCNLEGGRTGLFCVDGSVRIEDCRLTSAHFGGAQFIRSSAYFVSSTIEENENASGLRLSEGSSATLVDCVLRANDGEPGGAFLAEGSEVHLLGCTIEANGADDGGGGFALSDSRATLAASTISGNYGDQGGGAFECVRGDVRLENCLLTGNFGEGTGDAFSAIGSRVSLVHSTVSGNGQPEEAGQLIAASGSEVVIRGSILWDNGNQEIHLADGATLEASSSCVEGPAPLPGTGNLAEDPLFVEPGVFDFSDLTYRPKFAVSAGDYRLRPGSPCIDLPSTGPEPPLDLDGNARPCGAGPDAGAYEADGCAPERFFRGDADANGSPNVADAIRILGFLFRGDDPPGCLDAVDTDDNGRIVVTDPIYLLDYLFLGGPAPPLPFESCGPDRTGDDLPCGTFPACP